MDYGYPILAFCLAGILLLYGIILISSRNISLIPQAEKGKIKDTKSYARQFGKALVILSLAPLSSGIIWLTGAVRRSMAFLVLGFVICVIEGMRIMSKVS